MAFADNIRKIAKTKQLSDRIDKITQNTGPVDPAKAGIGAEKIVSVGDGTTVANNDSGTGAGVPTGSDGNPLPIVYYDPGTYQPPTTTETTTTTAGGTTTTQGGSVPTSGGPLSSLDNTSDLQSRTNALLQAIPGNDATWTAIQGAMESAGASPAEVDAARREYYKTRTPQDQAEISDIYAGTSIFGLTNGNWTPSPVSGDPSNLLSTSNINQLNTIVGVDPNNPAGGLIVRMRGDSYIPSLTESSAANQLPWLFTNVGPQLAHYLAGYYYSDLLSSPNEHRRAVPEQVGTAWLAYTQTILPGAYPTGFDDAFLTGTVNASGVDYEVGYKQGPPAPEQFLMVYAQACSGTTDYCPVEPLTETSWPPVGAQVLQWVNGGFTYNPLDSEVTLNYKTPTANVAIQSSISGDTYEIAPAVAGGFTIQNTTTPDYFLYFDNIRALRAVQPMSVINFYKQN